MNVSLPGVPALARGVAGVLIGGVVTAAVFLICVQGSFHEGITDFDFSHVLGTAIEGTATEQTGAQALGVIGDSAGPTALWTTIACGIVLLAFHGLVIVRLVRRGWVVQGLVLALVLFLAIGLIFVPYVDARLDTPIGPWGADQGGWTPVVFAGSSVIAALVGARCYDLAERASWWRPEPVAVDEQLAELTGVDESLELPEEGSEEGLIRH
ncbi:MAG TPA: hypothetical protein PKD59_13595 [Miltoncostaeaceae bacterium]|nr:hypothetical protein [Miltoncostaeaceae bacterium]